MPLRRKSLSGETFQMAPMIDMVFLLLVFFMTVSTMARESRPELELAVSKTARVAEAAPPRDVLTVMPGNEGFRYFWMNRAVRLEDINALLEAGSSRGPFELVLRGGPGIPWRVWEGILEACRKHGVEDVVFSTFED